MSVFEAAPGAYDQDHARRLARVAEQAAAVVTNALRYERVHQDAFTDPLTGLGNKRSLTRQGELELERARRSERPLSLLLLDVDLFKQINDTYGHQTGDRTLVQVADRMRALVRPYDICVRYAGDEYVVLLPGCTVEEAQCRRGEMQAAVESLEVPTPSGPLRPRVSIGSASWPADGQNLDALLEAADRRMYEDKARRKSELESYGSGMSGADNPLKRASSSAPDGSALYSQNITPASPRLST
jgi:diguanylate cyclase (GGDEF)-like protein